MSEDETFAFLFGLATAGYTWILWFRDLFAVPRGRSGFLGRLILSGVPFVCALVLFQVLRRFAASDVRDDGLYLTFYMVLGVAWAVKRIASIFLSAADRAFTFASFT